jgi:hypothetical protein
VWLRLWLALPMARRFQYLGRRCETDYMCLDDGGDGGYVTGGEVVAAVLEAESKECPKTELRIFCGRVEQAFCMTSCGRASHNLSDPGAERQDDPVSESCCGPAEITLSITSPVSYCPLLD